MNYRIFVSIKLAIVIALGVFIMLMAACSSKDDDKAQANAQTKVNGVPWHAVIKKQAWTQQSKSDALTFMFDNQRYFVIQGKNNLIDQGHLSIANKGMKFELHNRYGHGSIVFSDVANNSFKAKIVLSKRFIKKRLTADFIPSKDRLAPPIAKHIYEAAKYGDLFAVKKFIKAGYPLNGKPDAPKSPLAVAATYHHTSVVKYLLKNGAHPDRQSRGGLTPLAYAIQSGDVESAQAIITAGANVNFKNEEEVSLLFKAFEHESLPMVKMLIKEGASINDIDKYGFSSIHRAMSVFSLQDSKVVERLEYTQYLIEKAGYDPKSKDRHGRTALFYAANLGLKKTVKYLLSKGVDPNLKDSNGKDVFKYIEESEYRDLINPVLSKARKPGKFTEKESNAVVCRKRLQNADYRGLRYP